MRGGRLYTTWSKQTGSLLLWQSDVKRLLLILAGQLGGFGIACLYPMAWFAETAGDDGFSWSGTTFSLLVLGLTMLGALVGFIITRHRNAPPERSGSAKIARGLLGALLGVINTSVFSMSAIAVIAVMTDAGNDGWEELWESWGLVIAAPGLIWGYMEGQR